MPNLTAARHRAVVAATLVVMVAVIALPSPVGSWRPWLPHPAPLQLPWPHPPLQPRPSRRSPAAPAAAVRLPQPSEPLRLSFSSITSRQRFSSAQASSLNRAA